MREDEEEGSARGGGKEGSSGFSNEGNDTKG